MWIRIVFYLFKKKKKMGLECNNFFYWDTLSDYQLSEKIQKITFFSHALPSKFFWSFNVGLILFFLLTGIFRMSVILSPLMKKKKTFFILVYSLIDNSLSWKNFFFFLFVMKSFSVHRFPCCCKLGRHC